MVSGSLALLYFLLSFQGGRQGSGPNRGRSPVEWGDFPYICSFVQVSWLAGWASGLAGWASGLAGWPRGGNGRMDVRTDERKISPFYRTSSPIGAAALPPPVKTKEKVEQGKGTADHLMPLGNWLYVR